MLPRAELVFATFNHDRVAAAGPRAAAASAAAAAGEGAKVGRSRARFDDHYRAFQLIHRVHCFVI